MLAAVAPGRVLIRTTGLRRGTTVLTLALLALVASCGDDVDSTTVVVEDSTGRTLAMSVERRNADASGDEWCVAFPTPPGSPSTVGAPSGCVRGPIVEPVVVTSSGKGEEPKAGPSSIEIEIVGLSPLGTTPSISTAQGPYAAGVWEVDGRGFESSGTVLFYARIAIKSPELRVTVDEFLTSIDVVGDG